MPLSEYDRRHIHAIMAGNGNWFSARLLRFIRDSRPDTQNLTRLRHAFPEEVAAVEWWWAHAADDEPPPEVLTLCPYLLRDLRPSSAKPPDRTDSGEAATGVDNDQ